VELKSVRANAAGYTTTTRSPHYHNNSRHCEYAFLGERDNLYDVMVKECHTKPHNDEHGVFIRGDKKAVNPKNYIEIVLMIYVAYIYHI